MSDWSFEYKQAIALLAEKIYKSGLLLQINRNDLDWDWVWDSAVKLLPELKAVAIDVETILNYELSFNQCCNAIKWVYEYSPIEWQHLLKEIEK